MRWITIPQLAKVVGLSEDMLREQAEAGILPTWQNPTALLRGKRSRYRVPVDQLDTWLVKTLDFSKEQAMEVMASISKEV